MGVCAGVRANGGWAGQWAWIHPCPLDSSARVEDDMFPEHWTAWRKVQQASSACLALTCKYTLTRHSHTRTHHAH